MENDLITNQMLYQLSYASFRINDICRCRNRSGGLKTSIPQGAGRHPVLDLPWYPTLKVVTTKKCRRVR